MIYECGFIMNVFYMVVLSVTVLLCWDFTGTGAITTRDVTRKNIVKSCVQHHTDTHQRINNVHNFLEKLKVKVNAEIELLCYKFTFTSVTAYIMKSFHIK